MRVFLNPGHSPDGNPDPGAVNRVTGLRECDVAKNITDLVEKYLIAAGVEVVGNLQSDSLYAVTNTNIQLKQDKIQERPVILLIVYEVNEHIVSQRRFTTCSKVAKTSFLKPILRISFHICSIGFISGVYGGIKNRIIFWGTSKVLVLCQAAPSQQRRIISSLYFEDNSFKNIFIQRVLHCGITRKKDSPVKGSTAP